MSATLSPRFTPRPASPAARSRTRSAYSRQVIDTAPPSVRSATSSAIAEALRWKASHSVAASRPGGAPDRASAGRGALARLSHASRPADNPLGRGRELARLGLGPAPRVGQSAHVGPARRLDDVGGDALARG